MYKKREHQTPSSHSIHATPYSQLTPNIALLGVSKRNNHVFGGPYNYLVPIRHLPLSMCEHHSLPDRVDDCEILSTSLAVLPGLSASVMVLPGYHCFLLGAEVEVGARAGGAGVAGVARGRRLLWS